MRIGIYGGSFNPVHFGHIGLAEWTIAHTDLDQVWMMVSPNNPLKDASILSDEQLRLSALRTALKDHSASLVACDFEFHLPRPNYTANTMRELVKEYPEHEFSLLIGEDNWHIFSQWREYEYLLSHFRVFVYPRHSALSIDKQFPIHSQIAKDVVFLHDAPYFDISSTELRTLQKGC